MRHNYVCSGISPVRYLLVHVRRSCYHRCSASESSSRQQALSCNVRLGTYYVGTLRYGRFVSIVYDTRITIL